MSLKMKIHKLEPDIIAKIRSSITINSTTQCITELVLNSLDAKSTAIAVRINFVTFRIQIVDNGDGIMKDNLDLIGQRYMTSKCNNLDGLESHCAYYGFRGEALASVINISKVVKISSKPKNASDTWSRSFVEGVKSNVISVSDRPSYGTTVTIEGFLYNLPLRKKGVIPEVELDRIKRSIECLIIMHPNVSFSLRNDVTGDIILNNRKCENIISSFKFLHPEVKDEYTLIKVSKNNVTIKGLLFKGMCENKNLQYIYINKRPIKCPKIQIYINNVFHGNKEYTKEIFHLNQVNEKNKYYVYVINIKCPYSSVDILSNATKTIVEFKNWDLVLSCVEKLILSFLGCNEKTIKQNAIAPYKAPKSDCGISQINGVFKSYGFKRKSSSKNTKSPLTKKRKVISTQNVDADNAKELPQHFINNCVPNNDACVKKRIKKVVSTQEPHNQLQNTENNSNINFLKNSNNISEFSCQYKEESSKTINNDKSKNILNVLNGQNNDIQKFTEPLKKMVRPLPIKVFDKSVYKNFNSKVNVSHCIESASYKIKETNNNVIGNTLISREHNIHTQPYEKSFSMQYTNDENKGKNLIMDMFLKSTQVYNSDDEFQTDKKSDDTVFEVKSNYFLENNITTDINGKSKTMSISVNITKTIRKKFNRNKKFCTASKSVQTSLEKNYMVAKGVQTSLYEEQDANIDNHIFSTNDRELAENCTLILSRTNCKTPNFRFVHQRPFNVSCMRPIQDSEYSHRNFDKLFNFDTYNKGTKTTHNNLVANNFFDFKFYDNPTERFCHCCGKRNNVGLTEDIKKPFADYFRKNSDNLLEDKRFKVKEIYEKSINEHIFNHEMNPCLFDTKYQKEPVTYNLNNGFKNKTKFSILPRMDCKYKLFNPQFKSTQVDNIFGNKYCDKKNYRDGTGHITPQKDLQQYDLSYSTFSKIDNKADKNLQTLHNSFGDYYKGFNCIDTNPENKVTFSNLKKKCETGKENMISHRNSPNSHQKLVQKIKISSDLEDELFITLSNQQKQEILEKELSMEKQLHNKINLEWESQMAMSKEKEDTKQNNTEEFDEEWVKKQNNFGSNFYVNKRTGFTTFYTPKPTANNFKLCKRFEFMPKGLSPILKDVKEVDKSLSQNKKDKLETYILESYQSDLLVIKWQRYLKNKDIKTFFDEMYKEKLNSMESCIPTAVHSKKHSELSYPISFDKSFLNKITVIGQVDKKFIAVLEETKHLLVLFDQHAVHERIRLEELLEGYSNAKVPTHREKFMVFLSCNDLSLLRRHEQYLNFLGLYVEFFEDGISVVEIPLCLHNKFKDSEVPNSLNTVIQLLIKEIIDLIKETGGVTFKNLPKIIQNVINLEACRGAIKFGDKLSNSECEQLLKKLSICNLPFQCAHGRPTLVPLLTLNLTNPTVSKTVNFKNIY